MEDWVDHSYKTESATKTLTEGQHQIRLDFYENTGNARLSFEYQQTTSTPIATDVQSFEEGFESNNLDSWSKTTTSEDSIITANFVPSTGNYHARFYTNGDSQGRENAFISKSVSLSTVGVTGQFYFSSYLTRTILSDNNDRLYLIRLAGDNGDIAWAGIIRENNVNKWLLYTNGAATSSAININLDRYYEITLNWNAQSQTAEMYVNGEKILQQSTSNNQEVTRVDMGIIYTYCVQNPLNVYGDNFKLSSTI